MPDHVAGYQRMQEMAMANPARAGGDQELSAAIEGRQAEMAEMQRIAEERIKKQVEEWQAEQEKRWKRQTLSGFEQWQRARPAARNVGSAAGKRSSWSYQSITGSSTVVWDGLEEIAKVSLAAARQVVETQQGGAGKGADFQSHIGRRRPDCPPRNREGE